MIEARPMPQMDVEASERNARAQSRGRHFHKSIAALFTAVVVLGSASGMAVFVFFAARMVALDDRLMGWYALAGLGTFLMLTVLGTLLTRSLHCQLCHGTVLRDSGSRKHGQATKFPLISYRLSAAMKILLCGKFQCMYCGTAFRLRK